MTNNEPQIEVLNPAEIAPLELIERAQIDMQIATAKKYPRSITDFVKNVETAISEDAELAEACIYALPRAGKVIKGPSVRLAEICYNNWGNLKGGARIIANNGKHVTAQAIVFDLEKNVSFTIEKNRRITTKEGKTYNDDMQTTTMAAACKIAFRDATFTVIPQVYVKRFQKLAKDVAIGDVTALPERRDKALAHFMKMGVKPDRIFMVLGIKGTDDITADNLEYLLGVDNSIREGETTIDEAFPIPDNIDPETGEQLSKTEAVTRKVRRNLGKQEKPKPEPDRDPQSGDRTFEQAVDLDDEHDRRFEPPSEAEVQTQYEREQAEEKRLNEKMRKM